MKGARGWRRSAVAAVVLLATAALLAAGCGGEPAPPAHPFGEPPTPAAGVRAWAVGETGVVLVTLDGGASWGRRRFFLPQRGVDIDVPGGSSGWLITDAGAVLSTADAGATWTVRETVGLELIAVAATDAGRVWVVGNAAGAAGEPGTSAVMSSRDGGETWHKQPFGAALLADVDFADDRHGWLVALDRVWSTRDGGTTWRLRRQLGMAVLTGVTSSDRRHAFVAGWGTLDGAPFILATRDGGVTWSRRPIDLSEPAAGALQSQQIACAGSECVWVTCKAGVMASTDAGRTWTLQQTPAGEPLGIAAADRDHVLATTYGQPILSSGDGGATWRAFGKDGYLEQGLVSISAVRSAVR
jgi:photosystem II stability/assembly factor-like uncharacterized protein